MSGGYTGKSEQECPCMEGGDGVLHIAGERVTNMLQALAQGCTNY